MSKKSTLFGKIQTQTIEGRMKWEVTRPPRFQDYIFQFETVFRAFEGTYSVGDAEFQVFLVEKKFPDPDWDLEIEKYRAELAFVQKNQLVITVTSDDVDLGKFGALIEQVEERTTQASRLFD